MATLNAEVAGADPGGVVKKDATPSAQRQLVDLKLKARRRPPVSVLVAQARSERVSWRDMPDYLERASGVRVAAETIRQWVPELVGREDLRAGRKIRRPARTPA